VSYVETPQQEHKPPITVKPRALRANEGNPLWTLFCPVCRERTIPIHYRCPWCDHDFLREIT
jgi:hypothetical protein